MELKMVAVRLPVSQHRYLKQKANLSGINLQRLMAQIIDEYRQNDVEYKESLNQLLSELNQPQGADDVI